MNIHTAAHYMKSGFRIRRPSWPDYEYLDRSDAYQFLKIDDFLADDWQLIYDGVVAIKADSVEYKL